MKTTQFDRLKEIIEKNDSKYTMKDIAQTLALSFEGYESRSETVKSVKSKITEGEWNSLVNGITMSFLMSLHARSLPLNEAVKFANTEGVIGVRVVEEKE